MNDFQKEEDECYTPEEVFEKFPLEDVFDGKYSTQDIIDIISCLYRTQVLHGEALDLYNEQRGIAEQMISENKTLEIIAAANGLCAKYPDGIMEASIPTEDELTAKAQKLLDLCKSKMP
jgi:hypothetical protein